LGLSHVLLEKSDHLSDTIYKYQKGKHVMATPAQLVLRSDMSFEAGKREVVLGTWDKGAETHKINVMMNAEVKAIEGAKGDFTLTLKNGETVTAETVILAIGTQGNPNLLGCDGGGLPHVQYQLDDPGEYVDEHITVIGAGDAGIEMRSASPPTPNRAMSSPSSTAAPTSPAAKSANVKLLEEAQANGRMTS
jgi:cation diffusion facilitator CzcD-associated flavoprotein CzcO